jgi:diketogulonate reductase-like aldo/keto reductase
VVELPKSVTPQRIAENYDVWNFEISAEDMLKIDALDKGFRFGMGWVKGQWL